jgi:hypothetical protein
MARNFVAFRPGKKHPEIMEDLSRYKNQSARIRELYLLGLAVERGEYVRASELPKIVAVPATAAPAAAPAPPPLEPAVEYKPPEPAVEADDDILRNMLAGFE